MHLFEDFQIAGPLGTFIIIIIISEDEKKSQPRSWLSYGSRNLQIRWLPTPIACISMLFFSSQNTWLPTIGCVCYIIRNIATSLNPT